MPILAIDAHTLGLGTYWHLWGKHGVRVVLDQLCATLAALR